ncbi:dihydrofolate reductase family protein [Algoriphagus resistens]|uniref:dihydrofolate reductase family protein n=1 Tax=Algoriphagus resistens TaxID=1750590 RepID=UPI000AA7F1CD|nr:dihydrofolate reductase family protein [Algoriphagus resistens]
METEQLSSKVIAVMSMSLDGFVADSDDGVAEVFNWYFTGNEVEIDSGGADFMTFSLTHASAAHYTSLVNELGAVLTGKRTFEVAKGWGGNHGWGPAYVLTHNVPDGWPRPDSNVHFVTDSLISAVRQAKDAAAGKSVAVHGANLICQCLNTGLVDELQIDIATVLLGSGVRLFDQLKNTPYVLGNPAVITGKGVTHLRYPVLRKAS